MFHEEIDTIYFNDKFNKSLENVKFPQKLSAIHFGYEFDQPLNNVDFPESLKIISLKGKINQSLDNVKIMDKLEAIFFGWLLALDISNVKFSNLRVVEFANEKIINSFNFPPLLEHVIFSRGFSGDFSQIKLPDTIKSIYFSRESAVEFDFEKIKFPKQLKKLWLPIMNICKNRCYVYSNSINYPEELEDLVIDGYFSENITNLPLSLKRLYVTNEFSIIDKFRKIPFGCELYDIVTHEILDESKTIDTTLKIENYII